MTVTFADIIEKEPCQHDFKSVRELAGMRFLICKYCPYQKTERFPNWCVST